MFKEIFVSDSFQDAGAIEQIKMFFGMFCYSITGQHDKYCKKLVKKYVNIEDYDTVVVLTDIGVVTGAFIGLGKYKNIVI